MYHFYMVPYIQILNKVHILLEQYCLEILYYNFYSIKNLIILWWSIVQYNHMNVCLLHTVNSIALLIYEHLPNGLQYVTLHF